MAVTKILVDGEEVKNLSTPVRYTLKGNGKHKVQYVMDTDTIKAEAFKNCNIEKITIPHTITEIKQDAFKDSDVTEVVLQGTQKKTLADGVIPQQATLIASHETVGYYNKFNAQEATSKTKDFVSDIPVGCVLYERSNGELYTAEYDENITDLALGVCVIPKGMFDEHAHFIGLENLAYDNTDGHVKSCEDHYEEWCMFAPKLDNMLWHQDNIECYSQIPYTGLLYHTGEYDGPIQYDTEEQMPDLVSTNKPSGNMSYTENVDFRSGYDLLGVYDWSEKGRTPFVECCMDGDPVYVLPGSNSMSNPYYRGSYYAPQTIQVQATSDQSDHKYQYSRHYYSPCPYMQVSASDEVTANPILIKELTPSQNLQNCKGNPYRFYGSANEFLIPNIISKCTKPQVNTNGDYYTVWQMGTADGGTPTFFPAPYLCYEYAPGTGGTQHQWALGTPLEWICAFTKIAKIQNVLQNLKCPLLPTKPADLIQARNLNDYHSSDSGWYWGGLMVNDGNCFLFDGNSQRVESMITTNQPRLSTRPFIVI